MRNVDPGTDERPVFRVFISSTFRDLRAERDVLQNEVFPALQRWCREHGAQFQAIDLRWGISPEAGESQQTMEICLEELHRCRQVTPRPNFLLLLGDRYGWRPAPSFISEIEFQALLAALHGACDDQACALLESWYVLDTNATPPDRVLRGRDESYDDRTLLAALQHAATLAFPRQDDPRRARFFDSATHQEISHGALQAEQAEEHVFCYLRELVYKPDPRHEADRDAIDTLGNEALGYRIDQDAHDRLVELKNELRKKFGKSRPRHIRFYRKRKACASADYLEQFAKDVFEDLQRVIKQELSRRAADKTAQAEAETRRHVHFGRSRSLDFTGRELELDRVRSYLADLTNRQPLVITGIGGSGKTAIVAELADRTAADTGASLVVTRFLGTSPATSDLRSLLTELCGELQRHYHDSQPHESTAPGTESQVNELQQLIQEFHRCLALASVARPLVLFLDALDQLDPTDGAHYLGWVPWQELPVYTKLVLSVLQPEADISKKKNDSQAADDPAVISYRVVTSRAQSNIVPLSGMSPEQGAVLLDKWLLHAGRRLEPWEPRERSVDFEGVRRNGRALTVDQRADLLNKFASNGLPLWLKLAFEEARHWRAWDGLQFGHDHIPGLSTTVPGVLRDVFARLERPERHGPIFFGRALGYISAGRRGLTEEELLDVLSLDDEVMADFIARSPTEQAKPVAERLPKLPMLVWSRLYADLEPYLSHRAAPGGTVLSFYHRQVAEVVRQRYCSGDDAVHCHRQLAAYFGNHTLKPYFLEPLEKQQERMRPPYSPRTVDVRKVDELPYHLLQVAKLVGKDNVRAPEWDAVAELLTNIDFLEAKNEAAP